MHGNPAIAVVVVSFQIMEAQCMGGIRRHFRCRNSVEYTSRVRIGTRKGVKIDYIKVSSICKTRRVLLSEYSRYVL